MKRFLIAPAILALAVGTSAWATPQLKLRVVQGSATVTKADTAHTGVVDYNDKTVGVFDVLSAVGAGDPLLIEPGGYQIDLNGDVFAMKKGSVSLALTEMDLSQPPGNLPFEESFGGSLPKGWTITLDAYFDPTDKAFGTPDLLYAYSFTATATTATSAFAADANNAGLVGKTLFSITDIVTITATSTGQAASFDVASTDLPEPASLTLLGMGVAGLLAMRRRRA